ncbi:hypothetical protein Acr_18g0006510 [Actinidia rufa]|uniref:Uncharacterized protein n=1 Tax=Actinidia rufa TaxID=165716 RepID=A0A7J0G6S1_9ERIC|nr:hypothetical protein Acr_18g0006510 [Actinidia rufa]
MRRIRGPPARTKNSYRMGASLEVFSDPMVVNQSRRLPRQGRKNDSLFGRDSGVQGYHLGQRKAVRQRRFRFSDIGSLLRIFAISHHFSSPSHPQAKDKLKVTNRTVLRNFKGEVKLRILVFGTESVIPVENRDAESFRVLTFDKETNEAELRLNPRPPGGRKKRERRATPDGLKCQVAKEAPNVEGPYKVIKVSRPGTYWLEDLDGKALSHPWNAEHLKKYYHQ